MSSPRGRAGPSKRGVHAMPLGTIARTWAASALAAGATAVAAEPVSFDYSVAWGTGQLAGTASSGSVSFDSSLALPLAEYDQPGLLSGFEFTLRGKSYGLADVKVGFLTFDAAGEVLLFAVGTDCFPNSCSVFPGEPDSFYWVYDAQPGLAHNFYAVVGDPAGVTSYGLGNLQPAAAVPAPGTAALLLAGLAGWAVRRRA